jgi:hypothetical protein
MPERAGMLFGLVMASGSAGRLVADGSRIGEVEFDLPLAPTREATVAVGLDAGFR